MRIFVYLLISALFLIVSCGEPENPLLIDDQTYQNMFIEFAIINHQDKLVHGDRTTEELIEKVFQHYGVTPEQFRYTHDYFESDITTQLERMEHVLRRLRDERELVESAMEAHEQERRMAMDSLRQRMLNR